MTRNYRTQEAGNVVQQVLRLAGLFNEESHRQLTSRFDAHPRESQQRFETFVKLQDLRYTSLCRRASSVDLRLYIATAVVSTYLEDAKHAAGLQ